VDRLRWSNNVEPRFGPLAVSQLSKTRGTIVSILSTLKVFTIRCRKRRPALVSSRGRSPGVVQGAIEF
jgi:hypothetical protein